MQGATFHPSPLSARSTFKDIIIFVGQRRGFKGSRDGWLWEWKVYLYCTNVNTFSVWIPGCTLTWLFLFFYLLSLLSATCLLTRLFLEVSHHVWKERKHYICEVTEPLSYPLSVVLCVCLMLTLSDWELKLDFFSLSRLRKPPVSKIDNYTALFHRSRHNERVANYLEATTHFLQRINMRAADKFARLSPCLWTNEIDRLELWGFLNGLVIQQK